jgi:hypothetical protein
LQQAQSFEGWKSSSKRKEFPISAAARLAQYRFLVLVLLMADLEQNNSNNRSVLGVHSILATLRGKHGGNFANKPILRASTSNDRGGVSEDDGWSHHMRDGEVTGKDITSRRGGSGVFGGLLHGWSNDGVEGGNGRNGYEGVGPNGLFFGRRNSQQQQQYVQQQQQQLSPLPGTPGRSAIDSSNAPPAFTLTPSTYLNNPNSGSTLLISAIEATLSRNY